jgi:hypothetical protein
MTHLLDTRPAGGELVVLGDWITLPTSTRTGNARLGAIRYNPTSNQIEVYLAAAPGYAWLPLLPSSGVTAGIDYLPVTGGTITGDLTLISPARILAHDGSNTAPSYSFFAPDNGTGLYRIDPTTLGVAVGGEVALRIGMSLIETAGTIKADYFDGVSTSALYAADIAERYHADGVYAPGTVLTIGGPYDVTISTERCDPSVAGIVSTRPAYMMNVAAGQNDTHPYIALKGRVPCKVIGPISKGDRLVTSNLPGHAMAAPAGVEPAAIIGKALGDFPMGPPGTVEVMI